MMRVLIFAAGAATGFVLGTRAGRGTYEKIKGQSAELWHSEPVQSKVAEASQAIKESVPQARAAVDALTPSTQTPSAESSTPPKSPASKPQPPKPPHPPKSEAPAPKPPTPGTPTP